MIEFALNPITARTSKEPRFIEFNRIRLTITDQKDRMGTSEPCLKSLGQEVMALTDLFDRATPDVDIGELAPIIVNRCELELHSGVLRPVEAADTTRISVAEKAESSKEHTGSKNDWSG